MDHGRPLKIGITCYPSVGGSGILAAELGEELAKRGHEIHFISYEPPFRLPVNEPRVSFHPVQINTYDLFKYPDYTLPLSVKMAEVSRDHGLDVLHVHYAVPHATAAILAQSMLPPERRPRVVTTLHGTDTTLLGRDHPDVAALEPLYLEVYGSSPFSWAEQVVLIRVEPDAMYATAPQPERYPDGTAPARPVRLVPARRL